LIPAGTGLPAYRRLDLIVEDGPSPGLAGYVPIMPSSLSSVAGED
jgi:hypothetical protein